MILHVICFNIVLLVVSSPSTCIRGGGGGGGGGGGRLLVNCVPMREQRTAKLTLKSVFDILKLIPLFTLPGQKVTFSRDLTISHLGLSHLTL